MLLCLILLKILKLKTFLFIREISISEHSLFVFEMKNQFESIVGCCCFFFLFVVEATNKDKKICEINKIVKKIFFLAMIVVEVIVIFYSNLK